MHNHLACRKLNFSFVPDSLPLQQGRYIFMTILPLCEIGIHFQRPVFNVTAQ
jgi:hypothetical protein